MRILSNEEIRAMRSVALSDKAILTDILADVCAEFDVKPEQVRSIHRGKKEVSDARAWVCFHATNRGLSLSTVGKFLGRDHTSVINSCRRIRDALEAVRQDRLARGAQ
jgi:chromosomal replication initiation ATPase DnaA